MILLLYVALTASNIVVLPIDLNQCHWFFSCCQWLHTLFLWSQQLHKHLESLSIDLPLQSHLLSLACEENHISNSLVWLELTLQKTVCFAIQRNVSMAGQGLPTANASMNQAGTDPCRPWWWKRVLHLCMEAVRAGKLRRTETTTQTSYLGRAISKVIPPEPQTQRSPIYVALILMVFIVAFSLFLSTGWMENQVLLDL